MSLDPRTLASIQKQGVTTEVNDWVHYHCGCALHAVRGTHVLCGYHEGFEDGVEAATT